MATFNVLKNWHPLLGTVDWHDAIFPPIPAPVKMIPHIVGPAMLKMGPWGALTGQMADTVDSHWGKTMLRGTDIGPLILHVNLPPVPVNMLLPILFLTSGSKSEFPASGSEAFNKRMAVAVLSVANLNLDCAGPTMPPLPTGLVPAFTTHVAGMKLGDFLAGLVYMVVDGAVQFALNRIFAGKAASDLFGKWGAKIFGTDVWTSVFLSMPRFLGDRGAAYIAFFVEESVAKQVVPVAIALLVGSPIGYSPNPWQWAHPDAPGNMGNVVPWAADQGLNNYLNDPAVPDHPSAPPASTSAPPAGTSSPPTGTSTPPGSDPAPAPTAPPPAPGDYPTPPPAGPGDPPPSVPT